MIGNCVIAVSALTNQFFFLVCKLYLGPFSSKVISLLEKVMSIIYDSGLKCTFFSWCDCLFLD